MYMLLSYTAHHIYHSVFDVSRFIPLKKTDNHKADFPRFVRTGTIVFDGTLYCAIGRHKYMRTRLILPFFWFDLNCMYALYTVNRNVLT